MVEGLAHWGLSKTQTDGGAPALSILRCLTNSTGADHKVYRAGSQPLGAELSRKVTTHGFQLRHSLSRFAIKSERPRDDPSGRVKGGNVARGSPAGKILLPSGDIY